MGNGQVRRAQVDEEVKRALSSILAREVKDDRLGPLTSVTRVEVTKDLKYAKVFVSVGDQKHAMDALEHASGFIRGRLAKMLPFRRTPELIFVRDTSVDHGFRIAQLLEDVHAKDEKEQQLRQACEAAQGGAQAAEEGARDDGERS